MYKIVHKIYPGPQTKYIACTFLIPEMLNDMHKY